MGPHTHGVLSAKPFAEQARKELACRCTNAVVIGTWRDLDVALHSWNTTQGSAVFLSLSSGEVEVRHNSTFIPLAHDPGHSLNEWPTLAAAFGWSQCAPDLASSPFAENAKISVIPRFGSDDRKPSYTHL
jgi:hypothetical protein